MTQPDSIVPDPYNSQDYDRYSYVRNNPLKYTDPSGHSVNCGIGDQYCQAGEYTPGGLTGLYRHNYGDEISRDSESYTRLSNEVEEYMKSHSEYRPKNDAYLNRDWKNNKIFKEVRKDYWEERIRMQPGTSDTAWMLYEYYDWGSRSIYINNSYWSFDNFDWWALGFDSAATVGSIVGLNTVINAGKYSSLVRSYNFIVGPVSLGYTARQNGVFSPSTALSAGGLIPGPAGAIFSGSSVFNDVLSAYHQVSTPYVPLMPR